jgi:hypothetical protein
MYDHDRLGRRLCRIGRRGRNEARLKLAIVCNIAALAFWTELDRLPLGGWDAPLTMLWAQLYWPVLTLLSVTLTFRLLRRSGALGL